MRPPREAGSDRFDGMDQAEADTTSASSTYPLDLGGNHEKGGAWRNRRGFSRGFTPIDSGNKINWIGCWEAENELLACAISGTDGYYTPVTLAGVTAGYGIGGYGDQSYGS